MKSKAQKILTLSNWLWLTILLVATLSVFAQNYLSDGDFGHELSFIVFMNLFFTAVFWVPVAFFCAVSSLVMEFRSLKKDHLSLSILVRNPALYVLIIFVFVVLAMGF